MLSTLLCFVAYALIIHQLARLFGEVENGDGGGAGIRGAAHHDHTMRGCILRCVQDRFGKNVNYAPRQGLTGECMSC